MELRCGLKYPFHGFKNIYQFNTHWPLCQTPGKRQPATKVLFGTSDRRPLLLWNPVHLGHRCHIFRLSLILYLLFLSPFTRVPVEFLLGYSSGGPLVTNDTPALSMPIPILIKALNWMSAWILSPSATSGQADVFYTFSTWLLEIPKREPS